MQATAYVDCKVGGLANIANTCYLNSAVQCLSHNISFLELILKYEHPQGLFQELKDLLQILWFENCSVAPHKFVKALRSHYKDSLYIHEQNDVQEFLIYFIDYLNRSIATPISPEIIERKREKMEASTSPLVKMKRSIDLHWHKSHEKEYSPVIDLFYGNLISQIKCGDCHHINHNYELFSNLSILVEHGDLMTNIAHYFEIEKMNGIKCEKCSRDQSITKSTKLWRLPKILIILLKRFDQNMKKIDSKMDVPEQIDLGEYTLFDRSDKYMLKSIACHSGSLNSGHYCAACRHPSGSWFIYDDDSIIPVTSYKKINSSLYYVLFYEKEEPLKSAA